MPKHTSSASSTELNDLKKLFVQEFNNINQKLDFIINHINSPDINKNTIKDSVKKNNSITINKFPNKLEITGQTFEIKDILKQNKAIFEKSNKSWTIKYEDNSWFNKFKKGLEQHCSNIKIVNKDDIACGVNESASNLSDNTENEVFEFLEEDD